MGCIASKSGSAADSEVVHNPLDFAPETHVEAAAERAVEKENLAAKEAPEVQESDEKAGTTPCPFAALAIESASVASPPQKYSMGNDFVLVFALEEEPAKELVRTEMCSADEGEMCRWAAGVTVPCPAGKPSRGLRLQLLQTGVYDAPSGVVQGVATIRWDELEAGAVTKPLQSVPSPPALLTH
jgi:hypothetical protein